MLLNVYAHAKDSGLTAICGIPEAGKIKASFVTTNGFDYFHRMAQAVLDFETKRHIEVDTDTLVEIGKINTETGVLELSQEGNRMLKAKMQRPGRRAYRPGEGSNSRWLARQEVCHET